MLREMLSLSLAFVRIVVIAWLYDTVYATLMCTECTVQLALSRHWQAAAKLHQATARPRENWVKTSHLQELAAAILFQNSRIWLYLLDNIRLTRAVIDAGRVRIRAMASLSPRRTRQRTKELARSAAISTAPPPTAEVIQIDSSPPPSLSLVPIAASDSGAGISVKTLPDKLSPVTTRLPRSSHLLLLQKQVLLRKHAVSLPRDFAPYAAAVAATLVFAQEEAGTAVCVSHRGLLLTCAHCVAETAAELDFSRTHWLLFASGRPVAARCVAWDPRRDLALLRVIAAQAVQDDQVPTGPSLCSSDASPILGDFPAVRVAVTPPAAGARLVCVGHPGSEDLEAAVPGVRTGYDVLHASEGQFRGLAAGQEPEDNATIGALMHNCWTYWGHSGAPLLERRTGTLVGLHSSWDDQTGMRRGVPLEAVRAFLSEHKRHFDGEMWPGE